MPEGGRFVSCGAIRWHVHVLGRGPALLLLHGTGSSSRSFRALAPLLATRFTVVAPDLPGHARSRATRETELTLPGIAAALEELLDALRLEPVVAVGHSAGAALVARMTLDGLLRPDLLVGLASALQPFRGLARTLFPGAARLLAGSSLASKLLALNARRPGEIARVLRSTGSALDEGGLAMYRDLATSADHVAGVLSMVASWDLEPLHAELPFLAVPFLLLAGAEDRAVPVAQQRSAARRLGRGRLVVVPAAGHLLHEERPDVVARAILDACQDAHVGAASA